MNFSTKKNSLIILWLFISTLFWVSSAAKHHARHLKKGKSASEGKGSTKKSKKSSSCAGPCCGIEAPGQCTQECTDSTECATFECTGFISPCCKCGDVPLRTRKLVEVEPTQEAAIGIIHNLQGDIDPKFYEVDNLLSRGTCNKVEEYIEASFIQSETDGLDNNSGTYRKWANNGKELIDLIGIDEVKNVLTKFYESLGAWKPVTFTQFRRIDHDGASTFDYHLDGGATCLTILINDNYEGGNIVYLSKEGHQVTQVKKGSGTLHEPGAVHGAVPLNGVRYLLNLISYPNTECMFKDMVWGDVHV